MNAMKSNRAAARTAMLVLFLAFSFVVRPAPHHGSAPAVVLAERLTGGGESSAARVPGKDKEAKKAFTISGDVTGLFPGAETSLLLSIRNLNNFAISVQTITVDVADAGSCPASVLTVDDFSGNLVVAKDGSSTTSVAVSLSPDAGPACEDATWSLTYSGTAVKP